MQKEMRPGAFLCTLAEDSHTVTTLQKRNLKKVKIPFFQEKKFFFLSCKNNNLIKKLYHRKKTCLSDYFS